MMSLFSPERRAGLRLVLWWLAVVYALFLICHPFLIGCGCSDAGPVHTCGPVQYYASIGSAAWMLLVPLGMAWFRRQENMLIFLLLLVFVPLACSLFLLTAPALGWLSGDLFAMRVPEVCLLFLVTVPLLPYVGLLPLLGTGADTGTLYAAVLLYTAAAAGYGIYRYRHRVR